MTKYLFELGKLVRTQGVRELDASEVFQALSRHFRGDWGDCCEEDADANNQALKNGSRIFSVYHTKNGVKFWILTEATRDDGSRESTCILLPSEY